MGKPSINGPFSMAMLNNQRVYIYIYIWIYLHLCFFPMGSYGKSVKKLSPLPLGTSGDSPPGAPPGHRVLDVEKDGVKKKGWTPLKEKIQWTVHLGVSENVVSTPLYPMVLLIIIPMKNGYFIGNIPNIFRQTHLSIRNDDWSDKK